MTKKQYRRKIMQVKRNIRKYGEGYRPKITDRIITPKWGTNIVFGIHKGEKLTSYKQAWDVVAEVFEGTVFMKDIR